MTQGQVNPSLDGIPKEGTHRAGVTALNLHTIILYMETLFKIIIYILATFGAYFLGLILAEIYILK